MEQYIAKLKEQNLNMDQLKDVAKNVGAKNVHNIKTKDTLIEKIAQTADDTGVDVDFVIWVDPATIEEAEKEENRMKTYSIRRKKRKRS